MKKALFLILMLLFVCTKDHASCSQHHKNKHNKRTHHHGKRDKKTDGLAQQISLLRHEITAMDNGTSKENIKRMKVWVEQLETKLVNKLQHAEANLEKYQKEFNETKESEEAETSEYAMGKIRSSENKIQACQELLKAVDELKTKLKQMKRASVSK